jgi:hypothetical protein
MKRNRIIALSLLIAAMPLAAQADSDQKKAACVHAKKTFEAFWRLRTLYGTTVGRSEELKDLDPGYCSTMIQSIEALKPRRGTPMNAAVHWACDDGHEEDRSCKAAKRVRELDLSQLSGSMRGLCLYQSMGSSSKLDPSQIRKHWEVIQRKMSEALDSTSAFQIFASDACGDSGPSWVYNTQNALKSRYVRPNLYATFAVHTLESRAIQTTAQYAAKPGALDAAAPPASPDKLVQAQNRNRKPALPSDTVLPNPDGSMPTAATAGAATEGPNTNCDVRKADGSIYRPEYCDK